MPRSRFKTHLALQKLKSEKQQSEIEKEEKGEKKDTEAII